MAASYTWDGSASDGNWHTGSNWVGGSEPANTDTTTLTFDDTPGTTGLETISFSNNSVRFSDITFNSSDIIYQITGPSATNRWIDHDSTGTPTITVSEGFHFIESKVNFIDGSTIQGANGTQLTWEAFDLVDFGGKSFNTVTNTSGTGDFIFNFIQNTGTNETLNGDLHLGANTTTNIIIENGDLNFNWGFSALSGTGTLTVDAGSNTVNLGGANIPNTWTGELIIKEGTVHTNKTDAVAVNSTVTIYEGGTFLIRDNDDIGANTTLNLYGGTIDFSQNLGGTMAIDKMVLNGGTELDYSSYNATIQLTNATEGLVRNTGSTFNIDGTLNGTDQLLIDNGTSTGYMGAWAHANGADFASYNASNGVIEYTGYNSDAASLTASGISDVTSDITQNSNVSLFGIKLTSGDDISGSGTITLDENNAGEQTGIVKSGATNSTISNAITIGSNADEIIVRVDASSEKLTLSGGISGASKALVKSGNGELELTSTNSFTGTTYINQGTLNLNKSSGSDDTIVSDTIQINGGELKLGSSNQIGDTTDMILGGGTFDTNGMDDDLGSLTLERDSIIDMGSGNSIINFASLVDSNFSNGRLEIHNWSGTVDTAGGTDQLNFSSKGGSYFNNIIFFSDAGITQVGVSSRYIGNELVASSTFYVVPEASTYIYGLLATLLGAYYVRKKRQAKKKP